MVDPSKVIPVLSAIFKVQSEFFDDKVMDKSRIQIYNELADVAASVGVERAAVLEKLQLTGPGNSGSSVTQMLKFYVKYHRSRSVHVTPTVHLNGLEASAIQSSFTVEQWKEFLGARL